MKKTKLPLANALHVIRYPFFMAKFMNYGDGDEFPFEDESWRPGCASDVDNHGNVTWFCEGHGEMLLEVVGEFKPGRFPSRVFYVRQWRDPDGKVFGIGKLRMTTRANFDRMLKGYRHNYEEA